MPGSDAQAGDIKQAPENSPPPAVSRNSQKTIEVPLPGERYLERAPEGRESGFVFRIPSRENLLASANRLLKFEFPPQRDPAVYERLIKTNVISAGLSKRVLENLPLCWLETIFGKLWEQALETETSVQSQLIALFLLVEELALFDADTLMSEDIQCLGAQEAEPMHSYYYRGPLEREHLATLLSGQHYRTDFLQAQPDEMPLSLAYLACRRLSHPLPWAELLSSLDAAELGQYPRLARLAGVQALVISELKAGDGLTAENFAAWVKRFQALLRSPAISQLAVQNALPRPICELVIVEGETEKLLLPLLAEFSGVPGMNFNAQGVEVLPAGGKNNVLALYRQYARQLSIPICIVLDRDAESVANELRPLLRSKDAVFQLAEGEFEDTYDLPLTLAVINHNYQPFPELTPRRFRELARAHQAQGRVPALKAIWQSYNLGSFDKIEFAQKYAEAFREAAQKSDQVLQPTAEIRALLETIRRLLDSGA